MLAPPSVKASFLVAILENKFLSSFVVSFSLLQRTQIEPSYDINNGSNRCQFVIEGVRTMVNLKWWY